MPTYRPKVPTLMRAGPYRFFIWSNETPEPPHIHVESGDGHAKFWLDPVSLANSDGYNPREIARIRRLVEAQGAELMERWRDFFSN
ncbi:MAG: DUF4160 domain-containing protein [Candidatus Limnocylindria bacterium]